MRQLLLLLLIASAGWSQNHTEIRENEVWLIRNGPAMQLTRDGRSRLQVLYSSVFNRIAYYDVCREGENCTPSVIILDLDGNRLRSFQPQPSALGDPGPCASILRISWASAERTIGVECHVNPSLSEYVEVDLSTGKKVRDLAGLGFTPSPFGDHIAYIRPIVHFAPPYAQSNYLMVDGMVVYPLPKGGKPQIPDEPPIDVVRHSGSRFVGIHDFASGFSWSPDSKRIAFIDCISDWIEKGSDAGGGSIGEAVNDKCSIAVVARDGTVTLFPLPADVPLFGFNPAERARLSWSDQGVVLTWPASRTFKIP